MNATNIIPTDSIEVGRSWNSQIKYPTTLVLNVTLFKT